MKHFAERKHQLYEIKKDVFQKKFEHGSKRQYVNMSDNMATDEESK